MYLFFLYIFINNNLFLTIIIKYNPINKNEINELRNEISKLKTEMKEIKNVCDECLRNIKSNNLYLEMSKNNEINHDNINEINNYKNKSIKINKDLELKDIMKIITINYNNKDNTFSISHDINDISFKNFIKQVENKLSFDINNIDIYYFKEFGKKIIIKNQKDFLSALKNKIFKFYFKDKIVPENKKEQNYINNEDILKNKSVKSPKKFENFKKEEKEVIDHFISLNYLQNEIKMEDYLNNTSYLSSLVKQQNIEEIKKNKNQFINPEEYCKLPGLIEEKEKPNEKDYNFILSLIYKILNEKGINVNIYKNKKNIDKGFCDISLQYFFSGLTEKNKYKIYFKLDNDKINKLLEKDKELIDFINSWKTIISNELILDKNNIFLVNPQNDNEGFSLDLVSNEKNHIKNFSLLEKRADIKKVEEKCFIEGCQLSSEIFNPQYDNKDPFWANNEKRGGEDYIPPIGWYGYGLQVPNYDNGNKDWLSYDNRKGEFAVAYFGISNKNNNNNLDQKHFLNEIDVVNIQKKGYEQIYQKDEDLKHPGKLCGCGIYLYQEPNIAENTSGIIDIEGVQYKILLMCRVNPDKIRQPVGYKKCWVLNPTPNEIRPYRILIKKIFKSPMSGASQNEIKIFQSNPLYYQQIINEKDTSFYKTNNTQLNDNDYVINLYTSNDYIYINHFLREGKLIQSCYTLKQIKSWIYCLHCSLINKKKNVYNGNIYYRGVSRKFPNKLLGIGSKFIFSEFVSVSEDKNVAVNFACNGTLFIIRIENNEPNSYCNNIGNISCIKSEKEILITSNCTFHVTDIEERESIDTFDTVYLTCEGYKIKI